MSRRTASRVEKVRGRKREAETSPVSNQRSCGARFKAGMGQISKSPGVLPPFASSSHFPRRKEEEKQKKKSEVERREGMGRVGRKRAEGEPDTRPCLVWRGAAGSTSPILLLGLHVPSPWFPRLLLCYYHFSLFRVIQNSCYQFSLKKNQSEL